MVQYFKASKELVQQLKDADTLRSSTRRFLIPKSEAIKIEGLNPVFRPGEWKSD